VCESIPEMVKVLCKLKNKFVITRVKERIFQGTGNKVILLNLIVEDTNFRPHLYEWSGWWDDQSVKMIAEVQISETKLFYLNKQLHNMYEIERTQKCSEWEYLQGMLGSEQKLFPSSPLHNDPKCLL